MTPPFWGYFWYIPGRGPSGLLDSVLHALWPLRPCDPRIGKMIGQCLLVEFVFIIIIFFYISGRFDTTYDTTLGFRDIGV